MEKTGPTALAALGGSKSSAGIGKYLASGAPVPTITGAGLKRKDAPTASELVGQLGDPDGGGTSAAAAAAAKRKKKAAGGGFGDFSAW